MSKKIFFAAAFAALAFAQGAKAQNVQLFYDFGDGRNYVTTTFEMFKGDRLELVIHIAAYYGLRKSEILGLKWDSIDFDAKTITVRRKISNSYGNGKKEIIVENQL